MKDWPFSKRDAEVIGLAAPAGTFYPTQEPSSAWRQRLAELQAERMEYMTPTLEHYGDDEFKGLVRRCKQSIRDKLLSFGGWESCIMAFDRDMDRVIGAGVLLDGAQARRYRGQPSRCHDNSAYFCLDYPNCRATMSGYALSEDGVWRGHSWGVEKLARGTRLVETTVPRLAYFGFVRTIKETNELLDGATEQDPADYIEDMRMRLKAALGAPEQWAAPAF